MMITNLYCLSLNMWRMRLADEILHHTLAGKFCVTCRKLMRPYVHTSVMVCSYVPNHKHREIRDLYNVAVWLPHVRQSAFIFHLASACSNVHTNTHTEWNIGFRVQCRICTGLHGYWGTTGCDIDQKESGGTNNVRPSVGRHRALWHWS